MDMDRDVSDNLPATKLRLLVIDDASAICDLIPRAARSCDVEALIGWRYGAGRVRSPERFAGLIDEIFLPCALQGQRLGGEPPAQPGQDGFHGVTRAGAVEALGSSIHRHVMRIAKMQGAPRALWRECHAPR